MASSGHVVGNHTWTHPYLTKLTSDEVQRELERTSSAIEHVIGKLPAFFRPPYGDIDERVRQVVESQGMVPVLWDVDSVDWSGIPGPRVAANVIPHLRSNAVVLHHCAGHVAGTVDALPYIIETALAMNCTFVTYDKLSGLPAYQS
nr:polysaccharide deacetylase family protein [Alicyclobacillus acidiphilus]